MNIHWTRCARWLALALATLLLTSCTGPEAEQPSPEASPVSPAVSEPPSAQAPAGPVGLLAELDGQPLECGAALDEALMARAVDGAWDAEIVLTLADGTPLDPARVSVTRVAVNHVGQRFGEESVEVTQRGGGVALVHAPAAGHWVPPIPLDTVYTVYQVALDAGAWRGWFPVRSTFPTVAESRALEQRLQAALDSGGLLHSMEAAGDIDGDGVPETVTAAVTADRIPFLAIDGTPVLAWWVNDPSYYELARLLVMDWDGDGTDEVIVPFNNPNFAMHCADLQDGVWTELFLPKSEFSLTLEEGWRAELTWPDGAVTLEAGPGEWFEDQGGLTWWGFDERGAPRYESVQVTCCLEGPMYTVDELGIRVSVRLDVAQDLGENYWNGISAISIPVTFTIRDGALTAQYGEPKPCR